MIQDAIVIRKGTEILQKNLFGREQNKMANKRGKY